MRILVTGTSGHVGGAVARRLRDAGHEVVGLSRRPSGLEGLAGEIAADIAELDLPARVRDACAPCAAIVHAAASMDKDLCAPSIALANGLGVQSLLQAARAWECSHVVFISSVPVIGAPTILPITEDHPVNPPTAYHASKLFGEQLVRLFAQEHPGAAAASLRLTSPVGPGMPDNRILSVFVRRALAGEPLRLLGQGLRRQNYVDVRDVAWAVQACLERRAAGVFNIAGAQAVSNLELARVCIESCRSASTIEFLGQPDPEEGLNWDVSIAKARETFGYQPQLAIRDSIRALAETYAHRAD